MCACTQKEKKNRSGLLKVAKAVMKVVWHKLTSVTKSGNIRDSFYCTNALK